MTAKNPDAVKELRAFVDFLYGSLNKVKNKSYSKRKKAVFLPMYVNACDIADSICLLLDKERVNSAQTLLRSLQETWLNARFIFSNGNSFWIDAYLYETEESMLNFVKGLRQLRATYPDVETNKVDFSEQRLVQVEKRVKKFERYIHKKYPSQPFIPTVQTRDITKRNYSLRDRSKITDYILAQRRAPKGLKFSDEYQYLVVYKYLSGGAHVGASYLASNLVERNKLVTTILMHGDNRDVGLLAWSTMGLMYDITMLFSKQFGEPRIHDLKPYLAKIKQLGKEVPG